MGEEWGLVMVRWFVGRYRIRYAGLWIYEIRVLLCDVINLINIY